MGRYSYNCADLDLILFKEAIRQAKEFSGKATGSVGVEATKDKEKEK